MEVFWNDKDHQSMRSVFCKYTPVSRGRVCNPRIYQVSLHHSPFLQVPYLLLLHQIHDEATETNPTLFDQATIPPDWEEQGRTAIRKDFPGLIPAISNPSTPLYQPGNSKYPHFFQYLTRQGFLVCGYQIQV